MKIVVTANGADIDALTSPVFGRCPIYVFVDTKTMQFEAVKNPAIAAGGGAGIQAAQFIIEQGAQAVVTGNVGPNASNVFQAANVPVYLFGGGTVRKAVEAYKAGGLPSTVSAQARMDIGRGMGMGRRMGGVVPSTPPPPPAAPAREEEIVALKEMAGDLRKQLAEVMERLDRLEKEG